MAIYYLPLLFTCTIVSAATNNYGCECPSSSGINSASGNFPFAIAGPRVGTSSDSAQESQLKELYCLKVLDKLIARDWQGYIDRVSFSDIRNSSIQYEFPEYSNPLYRNPESEWILRDGGAYNKLDKCFRNLVGEITPRLDQDERQCLNKLFPDYMTREKRTANDLAKFVEETSREELPFKTVYTFYEITELLFENRNIDSLDAQERTIYEEMTSKYIKSEADKDKKLFLLERECDYKHARLLMEAKNSDDRHQRFAQIVKSLANRYIFSEILRKWVPGTMIPEYKYGLWKKARTQMEISILSRAGELRKEKRDVNFLCKYAAQFATDFFLEQKEILFDRTRAPALSTQLETREKYEYVAALEDALGRRNDDNRLTHVQSLAKNFKEGNYCLTNFIRMVENHQRYRLASQFTSSKLPYGPSFCLIKDLAINLMNPRYCYCDGTFCEGYGMSALRADDYRLIRLSNGKYTVRKDPSSYRKLPL